MPARQYFSNCYIEGNVDFIFGDSEAVFDHCHIHAIAHERVFVTAQSKRYPEQQSGYVFDHCKSPQTPRWAAFSSAARGVHTRPWYF